MFSLAENMRASRANAGSTAAESTTTIAAKITLIGTSVELAYRRRSTAVRGERAETTLRIR